MYVGHYKGVSTSDEFYAEEREALNFPTQVELEGQRYILYRTVYSGTPSQRSSLKETLDKHGIRHGIKID